MRAGPRAARAPASSSRARGTLALALLVVALGDPVGARAQGENLEDFIEEIPTEKPPPPDPPPKPARPPDAPDDPVVDDPGRDPAPDAPATDPRTPGATPEDPTPTTTKRDPVRAPDAIGAPASSGIAVRALSYDGLVERFDARAFARRGHDTTRMKRATLELEQGALELGLSGEPGRAQAAELATALGLEAKAEAAVGRQTEARAALELGVRLAPDLVALHIADAMLALDASDPGAAVQAIVAAVEAVARRPATLHALLIAVLAALAGTILVVLFLAAAIVLLRSFRYFAFDVHNAFPRGVARWQVVTVLGVLLVVPVAAGVGPLFVSLAWLVVAFVYLSRRERGALFAIAVLGATTPLVTELAARLFCADESVEARGARAYFDLADDAARDALVTQDPGALPLIAIAAVAEDHLREGRLDAALTSAREAVRRAPDLMWTHNNLGVIAGAQGNFALAEASFRDAASRDPLAIEPPFNLHLAQLRAGRGKPTDAAIDELVRRAPARIEALRRLTYRPPDESISQNRAFVLAAVPPPPLRTTLAIESPTSRAVTGEAASLLFFGLRPSYAIGVAVFLLFLLGFAARGAERIQPSRPCTRCGAPAGRRYDGEEVPTGTCSSCFHAFMRSGGTLDAGMRVLKEKQIRTHQQRTRVLTRVAGLVVPGGGHLYAGQPLRALGALVVVVGLVVVAVVGASGGAWWPELAIVDARALLVWSPLGTALVVHLLTVWDAFRISE